MPKPTHDPFESIDPTQLANVAGGAARAKSSGNDEVNAALTAIQSSLKDLGNKNNQGMDPMQMILMMMMMGGFGGGGGGGGFAGAHVATPPVINVDTGVSGGGAGGGGSGKKGW